MSFLSASNRFVTILFMMGNVLLLVLILLSGTTNHSPINRFYWLEADTSSIANAQFNTSTWTFWGLCEKTTDGKMQCSTQNGSSLSPGYPLSPVDNFNTNSGVPSSFISKRDTYYYLSRFDFAFVWLGLIFSGVNLLIYIFTFCSYAFIKVVWFLQALATLFIIANASVQTAVVVLAKNAFKDGGLHARIGVCMMAMNWAACFISIVLFFTTGGTFIKKAYTAHKEFVEMEKYKQDAARYQEQFTNAAAANSLYTQPQPLLPQQQAQAVPLVPVAEPLGAKSLNQEYMPEHSNALETSPYDLPQSHENVARPQSMIQSEHNAVMTTVTQTTNANAVGGGVSKNADITSNKTGQTTNSNNKYGIKFFKVRRDKANDTDEESV